MNTYLILLEVWYSVRLIVYAFTLIALDLQTWLRVRWVFRMTVFKFIRLQCAFFRVPCLKAFQGPLIVAVTVWTFYVNMRKKDAYSHLCGKERLFYCSYITYNTLVILCLYWIDFHKIFVKFCVKYVRKYLKFWMHI